ncbi:hypothetical protein PTD2_11044 [Pseudoalteromonas tunicata D2]|uniref:Uncharacterized protein n=1 Tax=Pseudoalteromonas tunicata D2 TaxID=87626 RepID=A4C5U3_9GAMM|nr:hypothetical protein PTD2_11044 [Pseudoalteromonas tunicata D2]
MPMSKSEVVEIFSRAILEKPNETVEKLQQPNLTKKRAPLINPKRI